MKGKEKKVDLPIGTIIAYGGKKGDSFPKESEGWYYCDGSLKRVADNPELEELEEVLDGAWGKGSEAGTFYLPDLRGYFLRGVSGESDADPDKNSRKPSRSEGANKGDEGNNVASEQPDQVGPFTVSFDAAYISGEHYSNMLAGYSMNSIMAGYWDGMPNPPETTSKSLVYQTSETRPKNKYVYYFIYAGKLVGNMCRITIRNQSPNPMNLTDSDPGLNSKFDVEPAKIVNSGDSTTFQLVATKPRQGCEGSATYSVKDQSGNQNKIEFQFGNNPNKVDWRWVIPPIPHPNLTVVFEGQAGNGPWVPGGVDPEGTPVQAVYKVVP